MPTVSPIDHNGSVESMKKLIVDGYNVLKTVPQFADLQARSLEAARDALVNQLSAKAHIYDIAVVFDAWDAGVGSERVMRKRGIRVIFTRQGERADDVIVRLARAAGDSIVVTKDSAVRDFAVACGCQVANPEALFSLPKRRRPKPRSTASDLEDADSPRPAKPKKGPAYRPRKRRHPEWRF